MTFENQDVYLRHLTTQAHRDMLQAEELLKQKLMTITIDDSQVLDSQVLGDISDDTVPGCSSAGAMWC